MRVYMTIRQDELIHEQFITALKEQGLTVRTANKVSSLIDNTDMAAAIRTLGANNRNIYSL